MLTFWRKAANITRRVYYDFSSGGLGYTGLTNGVNETKPYHPIEIRKGKRK